MTTNFQEHDLNCAVFFNELAVCDCKISLDSLPAQPTEKRFFGTCQVSGELSPLRIGEKTSGCDLGLSQSRISKSDDGAGSQGPADAARDDDVHGVDGAQDASGSDRPPQPKS